MPRLGGCVNDTGLLIYLGRLSLPSARPLPGFFVCRCVLSNGPNVRDYVRAPHRLIRDFNGVFGGYTVAKLLFFMHKPKYSKNVGVTDFIQVFRHHLARAGIAFQRQRRTS